MLSISTLVVLLALTTLTAVFEPIALSYLYVFFLSFITITIDVGLQITPERLVSLGMLGCILSNFNKFKTLSPIVIYVTYAIGITLLMSLFLPDFADQFPILRGRLRWLFQIFYLFLSFIPVIFIPRYINSFDKLNSLLNVFLGSCFIQSILALTQYLVHKSSGIDLFPLDLYNPIRSDSKIAEFTFEKLNIFRVTGLGGEPKHLAYTMVVGLTFSISRIFILGINWRYIALLITFSIALILSWSTQGILLFIFILILSPFFVSIVKKKLSLKPFFFVTIIAMSSFLLISNTKFGEILAFRTIDRVLGSNNKLQGGNGIEDFDYIILSFLYDNPSMLYLGTGLGNIHFHSHPYIPKDLRYYTEKNVYSSKKGVIRLISELGLFGLIFFFLMFFLILTKIRRYSKFTPFKKHILHIITFTWLVLSIYFMSSDGPPYILFCLTICCALYFICKNYKNEFNQKNQLA